MIHTKYSVVLAVLAILACTGCRKNNLGCDASLYAGDSTTIEGTWELRANYGGIAGGSHQFPDCNGNRIVFHAGTYKRYQGWQLSREGSYRVVKDKMYILQNALWDRIIMDNDTIARLFITWSSSTLMFTPDVNDGISSDYIRRRN